jgi:thioredoxin 2
MAAKPTIITCLNCGTKNRVRPAPEGIPRCSVCHVPLPWIVETDAGGFDEEILASVPVLVDFWAPWCGPCRMVSPVVEQMGREYAGRLKVVKLNIDEAPAIAARYGVQGIPLLIVIKDGREADRLVGAAPPAQLREMIERHVTAVAEPPGVNG